MKKILFVASILAGTFCSCGHESQSKSTDTLTKDTISVDSLDTTIVDSLSIDSVA